VDRDELIKAAREAIGEGQVDDYVLAPKNHADSLNSGVLHSPKASCLERSAHQNWTRG